MIQEGISIKRIGNVLGTSRGVDADTWPCHNIRESLGNGGPVPKWNSKVVGGGLIFWRVISLGSSLNEAGQELLKCVRSTKKQEGKILAS